MQEVLVKKWKSDLDSAAEQLERWNREAAMMLPKVQVAAQLNRRKIGALNGLLGWIFGALLAICDGGLSLAT